MDRLTGYDDDFHAWSQHQAQVLRRLARTRRDLPNDLDLEHVAEEIEDLGKSERKRVSSHLGQMLVHVIKLGSCPSSLAADKWKTEVVAHQSRAVEAYEASMAQHMDIGEVWRRSQVEARRTLAIYGDAIMDLPDECPFTLADLMDETLAPDEFVRRLGGER